MAVEQDDGTALNAPVVNLECGVRIVTSMAWKGVLSSRRR